jgi:hypothetical protein
MEKLIAVEVRVNEKGTVELHLNADAPIVFPYTHPYFVMERVARFCLELWREAKNEECPF